MARPEKESVVADLHDKLRRASAVVLTEYRGLKANDMGRLRRALRQAGLEVRVVKNTLLRLAAQGTGAEPICETLEGPIAVAFGYNEPTDTAKAVSQAARDFEQFKVRMGYVENLICNAEQVEQVAKLPGRQELQAKTVGALQGPVATFVMLIQGTLQKLVAILEAKTEKMQGAEG